MAKMDDISRVELAEISFQLGLSLAINAIQNGIPISEIKKIIPDFEGNLKKLRKVFNKLEEKDKQKGPET